MIKVSTGRKKWVMSKWHDPVSWMMLQHDDPVLFQIFLRTNRNLAISKCCVNWNAKNARTKIYGERRFDVAAGTLWNSLPASLRNEQSLEAFKNRFCEMSIDLDLWLTVLTGAVLLQYCFILLILVCCLFVQLSITF